MPELLATSLIVKVYTSGLEEEVCVPYRVSLAGEHVSFPATRTTITYPDGRVREIMDFADGSVCDVTALPRTR